MKKFFNWILVLGGLVGAFYGIGLIVPRVQTHGSKCDLQARPVSVMAAIADVESWPQWFPEISTVKPRAPRNDHPVWAVVKDDTTTTYELEIVVVDEFNWQGSYEIDEARHDLRFKLSGLGEGTRVQATRTSNTRNPWRRAQGFFRMRDEVSPLAVLNALSEHMGEAGSAQEH